MSTRLDLWPAKSTFAVGDSVQVIVVADHAGPAELVVGHLGETVSTRQVDLAGGRQLVEVGSHGRGGYAVLLRQGDAEVTSAFDVLDSPLERPRYGFVSDFQTGRSDVAGVVDSVRQFHLNLVQFYDWMYRHAALLPEAGDDFVDALDRPLSLATVRAFVAGLREAGARSIGYAAVYGAGKEYVDAHPEQVLLRRDGTPWTLADFLWIMDISRGSPWVRHIVDQMRHAVVGVGFDGLHLDQYGDPKIALTADGRVVDLAEELTPLIDAVRQALPDSTLIFNNVNDFPTRRTVLARQDATYIEVWSPHDDYADLVRLVQVARDTAHDRPVILAAYLEPFASDAGEPSVAAAKLALSTVWAAGGQYLLFGEAQGVLVDPYYPRYATLTPQAAVVLRRFADFSVAMGDLLFDGHAADMTRSHALGINGDVVLTGAPVSVDPQAGAVWLSVRTLGTRMVIQLVDYRAQADSRWNQARQPTGECPPLELTVRVVSPEPTVRAGHPAAGPVLAALAPSVEGEYLTVTVPPFDTWCVVVVDR